MNCFDIITIVTISKQFIYYYVFYVYWHNTINVFWTDFCIDIITIVIIFRYSLIEYVSTITICFDIVTICLDIVTICYNMVTICLDIVTIYFGIVTICFDIILLFVEVCKMHDNISIVLHCGIKIQNNFDNTSPTSCVTFCEI